jgi:hypothetical protein
MPGPNRAVVALCIAIVAVAAFLPPGLVSLDAAWFELAFVLLPPAASLAIPCLSGVPSDQPQALLPVSGSRAPPHSSFA